MENREIKFRGIRTDNNEFVYGSLVGFLGDFEICDESSVVGFREPVKAETIGQLTPLKAKEDIDIYDGDIIKLHLFTQELGHNLGVCEGEAEYIGVIEFGELGLTFTHGPDEDDSFYLVYAPGMLHEESYEVIGNIHENIDLLPWKTGI